MHVAVKGYLALYALSILQASGIITSASKTAPTDGLCRLPACCRVPETHQFLEQVVLVLVFHTPTLSLAHQGVVATSQKQDLQSPHAG
mmetsp:Transcript_41325/g.106986  ORF Transcript_41325/g.106986 Transcript_41325/m.106986 type:complete len:88 (-) Transcript_41325:1794-2057(-)